jgi:HK97 family phage portal protein
LSLRSLFGGIVADAPPVPYVSKWRNPFGTFGGNGRARQADQEMALYGEIGTLYGVVSKLANMTSLVNWKLWKPAPDGDPDKRTEILRHAALMVWNRPNPFMPRQEYVEIGQQHLDLTGEAWWVLNRSGLTGAPFEMWPVRPDRMRPVESNAEFIAGYVYRSPDGEEVPLRREDVIMLRYPAPLDLFRGQSAVSALSDVLDAQTAAAEWSAAFFRNSAQPGGIIQYDRRLQDEEFEEVTRRWREQHQGVTNAGRVAVLEGATFVPMLYTQKDMQFVESRGVTKQEILDAYAFPKFGLGDVDDVNRASAEASLALMNQTLTVPRLERIKAALNYDFLPQFGVPQGALEFDYEDPVPPDQETENATLTARVNAVVALVQAGADAAEACEACELPEITFEKLKPEVIRVPSTTGPPLPGGEPDDGAGEGAGREVVPAGA